MHKNIIFQNIISKIAFIALFIFSFFCFSSSIIYANDAIPAKPTKNIYVVDNAHMLKDATKTELLNKSSYLNKKYNTQLVVVTVDSLNNLSIEEYANKLFRKWGIGDKKENTGILILVAKNEHKARIEVGYGLEGIVPDGKAGRILKTMLADFKKDKYDEGIKKAHNLLTEEITNAKTRVEKKEKKEEGITTSDKALFIMAVGLIIAIILVLFIPMEVEVQEELNARKEKFKKRKQKEIKEENNEDAFDAFITGMFINNVLNSNNSHSSSYRSSHDDDDDNDRHSSYSSWDNNSSSSSWNDDSFGGGDSGGGGASDDW